MNDFVDLSGDQRQLLDENTMLGFRSGFAGRYGTSLGQIADSVQEYAENGHSFSLPIAPRIRAARGAEGAFIFGGMDDFPRLKVATLDSTGQVIHSTHAWIGIAYPNVNMPELAFTDEDLEFAAQCLRRQHEAGIEVIRPGLSYSSTLLERFDVPEDLSGEATINRGGRLARAFSRFRFRAS